MTEIQERAMSLLQMDQQEYSEAMYEGGLKFLYTQFARPQAEMLERSKLYWNWWKNQWELAEYIWLNDTQSVSLTVRRNRWRRVHHHERLRGYPNAELIRRAMNETVEAR